MKGISLGDDHVCGIEKFLSKIPLDRYRLDRIGIDLSVFRGGKQHETRITFLIEFSSIFKQRRSWSLTAPAGSPPTLPAWPSSASTTPRWAR